jgi:hypothetical protein
MCGLLGNFKVEDLPVGPRWFCTEKHFAQYTGLPVKESGYYGLDRIEYEDSGDEPEYGWEDDEYEAESKKRKRGFRKCSKCGDRGHNAPKCENPQYYEALARKEEMLDHVDYAIKEFTKDAKEYSLNRRYDMAKMRREDATDMRKLKRMIENNHFGKAWHFAFGLDSEPREYAPNALWDIWDAESFSADFKGHNVCVECKSDEIPLSSTDGGEQGLMDYYFNCSNCNFGWFVAVRDESNADEPNTVNVSYEGFLDMDAESLEEYGLTTETFYCRNCATTELKHFAYVKDFNLCIDCSEGRIAMGAESFEGEGCTAYRRGADPRYECTCKRCSFGPCEGCSEGYAEVNYTQRMELETKSLCSHCLEIHEDEYGPNLNLQPNVEDAWMYEAESKKLPPVEKAEITGIASGATMEGLDLALAAEANLCPHCGDDEATEICEWCNDKECKECFQEHMVECNHCDGEGEVPRSWVSDSGDRWNPPTLDVTRYEDCEYCDEGQVCANEDVPQFSWDAEECKYSPSNPYDCSCADCTSYYRHLDDIGEAESNEDITIRQQAIDTIEARVADYSTHEDVNRYEGNPNQYLYHKLRYAWDNHPEQREEIIQQYIRGIQDGGIDPSNPLPHGAPNQHLPSQWDADTYRLGHRITCGCGSSDDVIHCSNCNDNICGGHRCGSCGNCNTSDCCECSHNQAAERNESDICDICDEAEVLSEDDGYLCGKCGALSCHACGSGDPDEHPYCMPCIYQREKDAGEWPDDSWYDAETNGDTQLEESKKRTQMSMIRTTLSVLTFGIVILSTFTGWNVWMNKEQEKDITAILAEL